MIKRKADRVAQFTVPTPDEYTLILRSISEGVHVIDRRGVITFVNRSATEILGWRADELVGREQHSLIHHSHADGRPYDAAECPILLAIRDDRVHRQDDEVFWRQDG